MRLRGLFLLQTPPGYLFSGRAAVTPCRKKAPWLNLKMRLFFPALPSGRSVGLSFSVLPIFPPPLFPPRPPFYTPPPFNRLTFALLRLTQMSLILRGEKLGEGEKYKVMELTDRKPPSLAPLLFLFPLPCCW